MAAPLLVPLLLLTPQDPVDFDAEVRPLLADRCFACHGPDGGSREADLRLDTREGATEDRGGYAVVAPGDPDASELLYRVRSEDAFEVMPPPDAHVAPLTADEVALLARWVAEGAPWSTHWALRAPARPAVDPDGGHPVDKLVRRRLAEVGLDLAPAAPLHTLARRLSLDLTGLPPTLEDVARLRADPSPEGWAAYVDALLTSSHHAERLAMWWLDGARYADTDGFQQDAVRTSWPWRDWVVDAFADNVPFDRFTVLQVAGDLLPDATDETRLATSFHRQHMANGEGGRDAEESRVDYVRDRVDTTGTLWLGLTLTCAQCHDHKFDPVSQRDYYRLAAYFDSVDESGAAGGAAKPTQTVRSPYAARARDAAAGLRDRAAAELAAVRDAARPAADAWIADRRAALAPDHAGWTELAPARLATVEGAALSVADDGAVALGSDAPIQDDYVVTAAPTALTRITGLRLEVLPTADGEDAAWGPAEDGEFLLTGVKARARRPGATLVREATLVAARADVEGVAEDDNYKAVAGALDDDPRTGWTTRGHPRGVAHVAVFAFEEPLVLAVGEELEVVLLQRSLFPRALIGRFRLFASEERGDAVRSLGATPQEELARLGADAAVPDALRERLLDQFLQDDPVWRAAKRRNDRAAAQLNGAERATGDLAVMVLAERADPRTTYVLNRGVWDDKGEVVTRGVPAAVLPRDDGDVPTRLELAEWLVDPANPLTARAVANQLWQLLFGAGLVRTPDDLGLRGARAAHEELLDWLAVELVESGWDVRHLLRTIVTSETYRQDSAVTPALLARDPSNELLARGPRHRLPSWMLRDQALAVGGLLNPARGGPPVFPHQPPGVWEDQFMGRLRYEPTLGPEQHRRTLYAFWRRNSAPAFLFDTAMRRECEVGVRRTNSPLHALTLLNDRTYLEAARGLARASLPGTPEEVARRVFERVLLRAPDADELAALLEAHAVALAHYREGPVDAARFLAAATPVLVEQGPDPAPAPEVAAATALASLVLNLDEAVTRE